MSEDLRPPPFLYHELVEVVALAGDESYGDGEPVKGDALLGERGFVVGACPSSDRRGWLLEVMVNVRETFRDAYPGLQEHVWEGVWFREEMLATTGLIRE
jgi:hypothetical protein